MSGNIIGLYGNTNSTVTVSARNTTGLYPGTGGISISSGGTYGDANVAALLLNYTGNIQAGNLNVIYDLTTGAIYTDNYYYANGAPFSGNGASTYGNANVSAYLASGTNTANIITTGNISGSYILGNGSQLTGLPATYSNANVVSLLAAFGSNTISTTGNITAGNVTATGNVSGTYFIGNGSQLTGLPATYGNANVAAYLPTYTGDLQAGNITVLVDESVGGALTVTGNVTSSGYLRTTGVAGNIVGADYVSANYFVGNGSLLTGIVSSYGNANVATYLASGTNTANIITSGNVSGGYILGNGSQLTGLPATYGNANVASYLSDGTFTANIITSGNVSGSYILGNGSQLTGLPATYGNANVASYLSDGTFTANVVTSGNVSGAYFLGNGSQLTGLPASYGNANVSDFLANGFGSNTITTTGNVTAGNLSTTGILTAAGNVDIGGNINMAGRVFDTTGVFQINSAGNIVLVPTSSVQIYGNTNIIGGQLTADAVTYANADGTAGQVLTTYGNGITYFSTAGGGTPGGADTQLQFNNAGAFAGNAAMTFNVATGNIALQGLKIPGNSTTTTTTQLTTTVPYTPTSSSSLPVLGRILIGDGYFGNAYTTTSIQGRSARVALQQSTSFSGAGIAAVGLSTELYANLTANTFVGGSGGSYTGFVLGGSNAYAHTGSYPSLSGSRVSATLGGGITGVYVPLGNITATGISGQYTSVAVNTGSTLTTGTGQLVQILGSGGNVVNGLGYSVQFAGGSTPTGQIVGYYMPGLTGGIGGPSQGGTMRNTSAGSGTIGGYWFLRGDDNLAQSSLASISLYHEYRAALTSSAGAITVNKNNGQVQYLETTEAVTSVTFSNFVTVATSTSYTKQQTDTVTLIINQGATPYAVTLPTGATYRYAGGNDIVGTTANSTTIVVITATDIGGVVTYLITVSPEFV